MSSAGSQERDAVLSRKEPVGLVGMGAMGSHFGRRLLEAGYPLYVLPHANLDRVRPLVEAGASVCNTGAELGSRAHVIVASLPDVPQVREVLFEGDGLASTLAPGSLLIDTSTITPGAAREHHSMLGSRQVSALDAPVSGGPMRAADGTLTIMVGGDADAYQRALPVLGILGQHITHVGPPGSGQAVKLVNQLIISVLMVANAEALSLGVGAGIPLQTILDVVGTSSGSSYLLSSWMPRTLFSGSLETGFALDLLMKDLRAALAWAREEGAPTFVGALAEQIYRLARTDTTGRLDYSVVARVYEEARGVELRLPDA